MATGSIALKSLYYVLPVLVSYYVFYRPGQFESFWNDTHCLLFPPENQLAPLDKRQPKPDPIVELDEWISPQEFYKEYVSKSRPVLFKGLAKELPAYTMWTDQYFMNKFGNDTVYYETRIKKNHTNRNIHTSRLSDFLREYRDKEIFIVESLPASKYEDITIPKPFRCGNFLRGLTYVISELCHEDSRSNVHIDDVDNFICILDGNLEIRIINKNYTDAQADDFKDCGEIDVDRVDLCRFPAFSHLPRHHVVVQAGDCLFLPFKVYHQVSVKKERYLALSFWFQHIKWFNESDCSGTDGTEKFIFAITDLPSASQLQKYKWISNSGDNEFLNLEDFLALTHQVKNSKPRLFEKIFKEMDINKDDKVSMEEMYSLKDTRFKALLSSEDRKTFTN